MINYITLGKPHGKAGSVIIHNETVPYENQKAELKKRGMADDEYESIVIVPVEPIKARKFTKPQPVKRKSLTKEV